LVVLMLVVVSVDHRLNVSACPFRSGPYFLWKVNMKIRQLL
jgi:hypothetical protein